MTKTNKTRKARDVTFRRSDIVRAYKAAVDAKMPNPRIVIDTKAKTLTIIANAPASADDHDQTNEWDEVCETPATGEASR
jgi:hypothetical protein